MYGVVKFTLLNAVGVNLYADEPPVGTLGVIGYVRVRLSTTVAVNVPFAIDVPVAAVKIDELFESPCGTADTSVTVVGLMLVEAICTFEVIAVAAFEKVNVVVVGTVKTLNVPELPPARVTETPGVI